MPLALHYVALQELKLGQEEPLWSVRHSWRDLLLNAVGSGNTGLGSGQLDLLGLCRCSGEGL